MFNIKRNTGFKTGVGERKRWLTSFSSSFTLRDWRGKNKMLSYVHLHSKIAIYFLFQIFKALIMKTLTAFFNFNILFSYRSIWTCFDFYGLKKKSVCKVAFWNQQKEEHNLNEINISSYFLNKHKHWFCYFKLFTNCSCRPPKTCSPTIHQVKKGMIRRRKEGQKCRRPGMTWSNNDKVSLTLFVRAIVPHKAEMYFSCNSLMVYERVCPVVSHTLSWFTAAWPSSLPLSSSSSLHSQSPSTVLCKWPLEPGTLLTWTMQQTDENKS